MNLNRLKRLEETEVSITGCKRMGLQVRNFSTKQGVVGIFPHETIDWLVNSLKELVNRTEERRIHIPIRMKITRFHNDKQACFKLPGSGTKSRTQQMKICENHACRSRIFQTDESRKNNAAVLAVNSETASLATPSLSPPCTVRRTWYFIENENITEVNDSICPDESTGLLHGFSDAWKPVQEKSRSCLFPSRCS